MISQEAAQAMLQALKDILATRSPRAHYVGCDCGGSNPPLKSCHEIWTNAEKVVSLVEDRDGRTA